MASTPYAAKSAYRGEIASRYDEHRTVEAVWAVEQEFLRKWTETLAPGATLLDIPAGTGRFVEFYLVRGLRVHAWDISADMIAEVRRRFPAAGDALDARVGDAEKLALADGAVDHVVCWRFFHLIPVAVMDGVLREFRRVTRGSVLLQVFAVRPVGMRITAWQKVKDRLRPWWRRLRSKGSQPWAHITSYAHREENLLAAFARTGWSVAETHTIAEQDGLPTRVFVLRPAR